MCDLNLDDLLAIQLALNAEIDAQQQVVDSFSDTAVYSSTFHFALKRRDNAELALKRVMAMVDSEMAGDLAGPVVGAELAIKLLEPPPPGAAGCQA
jgi:hypothetical protein